MADWLFAHVKEIVMYSKKYNISRAVYKRLCQRASTAMWRMARTVDAEGNDRVKDAMRMSERFWTWLDKK